PTADVFPNQIQLRQPQPLAPAEQEALLRSASEDEPWALPAILLMMRSGLTRSEILALDRGDIDRTGTVGYSVQIETDDVRKPNRTRTLQAGPPFPEAYEAFLSTVNPEGRLFPVGFQAINGMVDRVRRRAKIARTVTPRTLRETFIAGRLAEGVNEEDLLPELGLALDLRNRQSLRRFRPSAPQSTDAETS
ncbi:MAG: hypothetical protein M3Y37_02990, partial [Chloroflexota bacterium]|nr:hypothetical protein [Chloroflexota bacterium]